MYCSAPPVTVEHMPPTGMFRERRRLSGLEFACCRECNFGTRAADLAAAFMARIPPFDIANDWRLQEAYNLVGGIAHLAPEVIRELFGSGHANVLIRRPSGFIQRGKSLHVDGPVLTGLMTVFTAKLGMALFRQHVGQPLPMDGGVYTQFFFNAGLDQSQIDAMLSILPTHDTLRQGKSHASEQFEYRYNSDDRTIVAALAGFHGCLHVRMFAMSDPERYGFLLDDRGVDLVRPGELVGRAAAVMPPGAAPV